MNERKNRIDMMARWLRKTRRSVNATNEAGEPNMTERGKQVPLSVNGRSMFFSVRVERRWIAVQYLYSNTACWIISDRQHHHRTTVSFPVTVLPDPLKKFYVPDVSTFVKKSSRKLLSLFMENSLSDHVQHTSEGARAHRSRGTRRHNVVRRP